METTTNEATEAYRVLNGVLQGFYQALEPYHFDTHEQATAKIAELVRADLARRAPAPADERALLPCACGSYPHVTYDRMGIASNAWVCCSICKTEVYAESGGKNAAVRTWNAARAAHQAALAQPSAAPLGFISKEAMRDLKLGKATLTAISDTAIIGNNQPIYAAAPTSDQQAGAVAGMWQLVEDLATFNGARGMSAVNELVGRAKAILAAPAAIEQAGAPSGYKLVPFKCTPEMRAAWDRAPQDEDGDVEFHNAYRAMIDAAPAANQKGGAL